MNNIWSTFIKGIMKIPGAKVDRVKFLSDTFRDLTEGEMRICIEEGPLKVVDASLVESAAKSIISSHTKKVTAISAVSGIPGGVGMLAAVPADMANYYYHIVAVGQKLGYLYGYPDMLDAKGNLTEDGEIMLTAFIGVMNKVAAATEVVKKIAVEVGRRVSEDTATRMAGKMLQKQIVAQSLEVVARKLGTQISAKTGGRVLTKVIPLVSGVVCGVMTYRTFKPQAKRLMETLKSSVIKAN